MNKSTLILVLALALTGAACGKKQQAAGEPAAAATDKAAEAAASVAPTANDQPWETVEEQTEREGFEVNEPMPPTDESSAPPTVRARAALIGLMPDADITGDITLYQDAYGTGLLRIENLRSPADLDVQIAFTRSINPSSLADVKDPVIVGALKGASGNMNFTISQDVDLSDQRSLVLILKKEQALLAYCPLTRP